MAPLPGDAAMAEEHTPDGFFFARRASFHLPRQPRGIPVGGHRAEEFVEKDIPTLIVPLLLLYF